MIIDCHTHLNRYMPEQPPTLRERYDLMRTLMDAHRIGYALVLTSYDVTPDRPSVEETLAMVEGDPRIGVVAGVSTEGNTPEDVGALRALLEAGRIRGLKLYPGYEHVRLTAPGLHPLYALAAEFGVPVMIHTGDTYSQKAKVKYAHPLWVDEIAVDFRDTTFLICHMGNPWFTEAMEVVYKNDNVVADISGLTLGEFQPRYARNVAARLNEAIAYINDPTKLLFGTDWPISDVGSYLAFVQRLELTDEERAGLMSANAARVFRLDFGGEGGA